MEQSHTSDLTSENLQDVDSCASGAETRVDAKYSANNTGFEEPNEPEDKRVRAEKMLRAGFTIPEICESLGMSKPWVYRIKSNLPKEERKVKLRVPGRPSENNPVEVAAEDRKKDFLLRFFRTKAILSLALQGADLPVNTYYAWLKSDEEFAARVDEIREATIDYVEDKLFNLIELGNPQATIFYMKTKAKHRGYNESVDINQVKPFELRVIEPYVDPLEEPLQLGDGKAIDGEYEVIEP